MNYVYIAGPLFDDHERNYLESIAEIFETRATKLFCLIEMQVLFQAIYTRRKEKIFTTDLNALKQADIIVALLTGRDETLGLQLKLVTHLRTTKINWY